MMLFVRYALFLFTVSSVSAEPLEVDALTFNIRLDTRSDGDNAWPKRQAMVCEWLRGELPDVVGLQEALHHQLEAILEAVPEYASFGVGRDDGRRRGEYSAILYKKDRFEVTNGGTFWLSDTPAKPGSRSWGNGIPRICTWALLKEKESDGSFYVFNTHWDHRSQPSREGAAKLIAERIAAREHADKPVILMGDFNASESNPAITALTTGPLMLLDTFRVVHPDEKKVKTFHGFRGGEMEGGKIDHVFVLPGTAEVKSAQIVRYHREGRYLSDHYPVRARLIFP